MPRPLVFDTPPTSSMRLSVIIPVRDQAALLPRALESLAKQTDAGGEPLAPTFYEILVLANNCRDETAAAARRFAGAHPRLAVHVAERALPGAHANVGTARRLVMDEACRRLLARGRPEGVIASTDGDTVVAPDWVAQTLFEIAAGADAVGGRIHVSGHQDAGACRYHRRDLTYHRLVAKLESLLDPDPADPWPRHHQFFGGSLAVTAAAYRAAGGLPAVPCLEDMALERTLRRVDARLRHSPRVRVSTSARQHGRAALGLATQLHEWTAMAHDRRPHLVQSPAALAVRFQARADLRHLWQENRAGRSPAHGDVAPLAEVLCVPVSTLSGGFARPCDPFGLLWEPVARAHDAPDGLWARRWPLQPITAAISDLRARLCARTGPVDTSPRAAR